MILRRLLTLGVAAFAAATSDFDEAAYAAEDVITKDVAIIGGGASGTYAAVRLREDFNTSIVVIEIEDHLGGHVNTFIDPNTRKFINYGVEAYIDYGPSADFFKRFNIPTQPYVAAQSTPYYVSSADGSLLSNYEPPSFNATVAAFSKWLEVTGKYAKHLIPGMWIFWKPQNIPSDLHLTFG